MWWPPLPETARAHFVFGVCSPALCRWKFKAVAMSGFLFWLAAVWNGTNQFCFWTKIHRGAKLAPILGGYNQHNVPPSRKAPSHPLCTGPAGRSIKMGIGSFALIEWCGSAAGNLPNLSGPAGALTIIIFLNSQLWKKVFGKDKRRRLWQCPSPQPPQEQGATSPCPSPFASKGSCTWMTWGAEGVWWLRYHQHKRDPLPPLPPYFPHQPSLLPFILYQAVINPSKELMLFNTK